MELLKKRPVALLVAIVLVFVSTVVNVNHHLEEKAEAVEDLWEAGNGPEDQLMSRASYASQLWSVTQDLGLSGTDALRSAYNRLYEAEEKEDMAALARANAELTLAADALWTELRTANADAETLEDAEYYYNLQWNAARLLAADGEATVSYNDAVAEYRSLCRSFPLLLLKPLIFVDTPVPFEA